MRILWRTKFGHVASRKNTSKNKTLTLTTTVHRTCGHSWQTAKAKHINLFIQLTKMQSVFWHIRQKKVSDNRSLCHYFIIIKLYRHLMVCICHKNIPFQMTFSDFRSHLAFILFVFTILRILSPQFFLPHLFAYNSWWCVWRRDKGRRLKEIK